MPFLVITLAALLLQGPVASTSSLEGKVVAPDGRPMQGADVMALLVPTPSPYVPPPRASSDSSGKFRFADLKPGDYRIRVAVPGYAAQEYGSAASGRRGGGTGTVIKVEAGRSVQGITISMSGVGTISGRVLDAGGQPLVGLAVNALLKTYEETGNVFLVPEFGTAMADMGAATTNDRGEFRITALSPGRYYVWAATPRGTPSTLTGPDSERFKGDPASPGRSAGRYTATYFPGTADPNRATEVEVRAAGEIKNVDFTLARTPVYGVRGRVVDAKGESLPGFLNFAVIPATSEVVLLPETSLIPLQPDGTFELTDIPAGDYWVTANSSTAGRAMGYTRVRVVDADVENVQVVLLRGPVSVSGNLRVDGPSRLSEAELQAITPELRVSFIRGQISPYGVKAEVLSDGSFTIPNLGVNEHRLVVTGLPRDYFLKEARFGENDALAEPIQLNTLPTPALNITITRGTDIEGSVRDGGKPVANQLVVLTPEGIHNRPDLYKTAITDADGRFRFAGVAPREYKAFAWKNLEPFRYFDPAFIRAFDAQGTVVRVGDTRTTLDVTLIP